MPVLTAANPQLLTLLREAKGWNQGELAAASGLTQSFLSRAERGFVELGGDRLVNVADALHCPVELLTHDDVSPISLSSTVFHRRRRSRISVVAARRFEAISHLTRITVDGLISATGREPTCLLAHTGGGDPAVMADRMRQQWQIPDGPIADVCALLDRAGIVVVVRRFDQAAQDAMSLWPHGRTPSIVVRWGMSVDRLRFTLCHELAHLVMHAEPGPDVEREADRFAAEFLLPAEQITPQLRGLTTGDFDRLMDLKRQWRVSIAALIQRAMTLGLISERQFREFRVKLSQFGWNTVEPIDLQPEQPHLLESVINDLSTRPDLTEVDIAAAAGMTPEAFSRHYRHHTPPTDPEAVQR
ncbi:XRE family transcriptional regulator [Mycolicibacterium mucogenicum]|uniref:helix-turn-helix domain-containing protein n=1 Tax=Mycolicibacterium mucogenicum TaxID=56689 RepID=UPI00226ABBC2|nr:XRE family transcriptional regulator [Mycolicibacterium mucogenicum]MCX8565168.1 XRE family transcriptional regulator [Mycolicibacterium mucogenicum]